MTSSTTIGSSGTTFSQQQLDTFNGTSSTSSSTSSSANSASSLQNTFLTLLVTQLQNQDPTNPTDSSQMTSQLAQINTVSGISQLNTSLSSLATQLSAGTSAQSASLIGKSVLAPGNSVTVASGAASTFGVQTAGALSDLQVSIKNSAGTVVNTLDLGAQAAGVVPISWTPTDSTGATLPDGKYTITATGTLNGASASTTALTTSTVQSIVTQADGTTGLNLSNGSEVGLTSVASIF